MNVLDNAVLCLFTLFSTCSMWSYLTPEHILRTGFRVPFNFGTWLKVVSGLADKLNAFMTK